MRIWATEDNLEVVSGRQEFAPAGLRSRWFRSIEYGWNEPNPVSHPEQTSVPTWSALNAVEFTALRVPSVPTRLTIFIELLKWLISAENADT